MAGKDNLTAILYAIEDMRLEQRPIPVPTDNQVLLQMEVVGICGSDVHFLVSGRIGPFVVEKPMIMGHEASGTVVQCGKNVKHLKPGDRVAIEPGVPCRMCYYCKHGSYNLCPDMAFCATPPIDGNLSRYYVHDADFCFKLPDNISFEEGVLMEPLSCGVHACRRANVRVGHVCVVLGAGTIGLVTMMTAKAFGASKVLITDTKEVRLKKAKELGADYVLKIEDTCAMAADAYVKKIRDMLGEDPDSTFECAGSSQCTRIACTVTKTGGVVILVGMGKDEVTLPLAGALFREIDIRGCFRYVNCYPTAIEMVRTGKVNVKPLVTHHFTIEETVEAFTTAKTGAGDPIKILIHTNPNWKK